MFYDDGSDLNRFETAMEAAKLAWWWMELPSGVVFFSPNKAHMIGYQSKDFVHYKDFMTLVHPDDQETAMDAMRTHLSDKAECHETFYHIKQKDEHYVQFYDRGKIVSRNDTETIVAGVDLWIEV